jgi:hypothetical protein
MGCEHVSWIGGYSPTAGSGFVSSQLSKRDGKA